MQVYVDRIEGEVAVVECEGRTYDVPIELLPAGTDEGHVLRWVVERDLTAEAERHAAATNRIADDAADDDGGDFSL